MFVVRLMVLEQAEAGSIFPQGMLAHSAHSGDALSSNAHMCGSYNCNAHPWLYDVWLCWFLGEVSWLHFQAHQTERSDGVGPGRLGGISFSFRSHGKEDFRWMLDDWWYARPLCNQFDVSNPNLQITTLFSVGVDISPVSSISALRPG